jgi:hypothetical protein
MKYVKHVLDRHKVNRLSIDNKYSKDRVTRTPKNTQISGYCIQHYCQYSFGIIKQLLLVLAVNIIIVHPLDVVFPRARTNNDLQNITYKTKDRVTRTSLK